MTDEEIVAALAEAIPGWVGLTHDEPGLLAAALLPVVRRVAEQRVAEELLAAAEEIDAASQVLWDDYKHGDPSGPNRASPYAEGTVEGYDVSEQRLRARAAALTATPNHGRNAT